MQGTRREKGKKWQMRRISKASRCSKKLKKPGKYIITGIHVRLNNPIGHRCKINDEVWRRIHDDKGR